MRFTLRQLEVFLAIARHGNTTLAAESLHLSQSAVSAALNQLEQNYNTQLFERRAKRLELNALGHALRNNAESLLAQAEALDSQLMQKSDTGNLTVGASYTIANYHAVAHLAAYLDQYPNANVDFKAGNSPDVVNMVLNYEVDLGMIESEINDKRLQIVPWIDDELIVFCSKKHPLANKKKLTTSDLCETRWILREADSGARQSFERAFQTLLPKMNIYMEFRHNEAIKRAVQAGLGIGCLSHTALEGNFKSGSLIPLEPPGKHRMKRKFYIILPKKQFSSPAIDSWLATCGVKIQ